ncbi:phage baseplate assembly protein [Yersinia intermedia]|uniref:phage baseplate assembly protein n=1 Tax=Yersinia intermedia TaxID=631 RepID=UPI0035C8A617
MSFLNVASLSSVSGGQRWINPGTPCVVKLDNDAVLNGYIDRWDCAIATTTHQSARSRA